MDNIFKLVFIIVIFFPSVTFANAWVSTWADGPAPATFVRTPTSQTTYINMPDLGGHAAYTLPTEPVRGRSGPFANWGPNSTATGAAVAAKVSIPMGAAAGAAAATTATMMIPKAAMAKAVTALVRFNPYVSAAMTFGWLSYAGYHYLADAGVFTKDQPTGPSCNKDSGTLCKPSPAEYCSQFNRIYSGNPIVYTIQGGIISNYCGVGVYGGICQELYNGQTYLNQDYFCITPATKTTVQVNQTDQQVQTDLSASPLSSSGDSAANFDAELTELIQNGYRPDTDGNPPTLTGPVSVAGPHSVTTTPTGDTITNNTTYNNTYNNNSVTTTQTDTSTTVPASGPTTTTTTTSPPDTPIPQQNQQTDCDKYPDSIGCAKFGDSSAPEVVQTVNVTATLNPTSLGAGSCPSPNVVHLSNGRTVTVSYQSECDFATSIAPIMIAFAWLSAGMLVLSPVRG